MYNKIEDLYKKKSAYNRITRKFFIVYFISFFSIWLFGLFKHTYISIILVLVLLCFMKRISENELKKKFYIFKKLSSKGNTLQDEINNQEIGIMKKYLIVNNLYNEKNVINIINHYRNLIIPKNRGNNFWTIVSLIITLIIPFVNKDGFNIELLNSVLPYFLSLIIVCGIIYLSYKEIFTLTKSLKGELRIYERLEEIFSEILIEINMTKSCYNNVGGNLMSEKEFDSSINEYEEVNKPNGYIKQLQWDMAIGLQEVDNLKPSKHLEELLEENVVGKLSLDQVKEELRTYYVEKEKNNEVNYNELECDFVSIRIVELLQEEKFELSVGYLKYVHKYLFQDVYEFAGNFRVVDFSKPEIILNKDSVAYGDCRTLEESLEYDISLEKEKNYKDMNMVEVINNITKFSSNIWQVHPFREGNTRTIALFIEKYLISLGYNVDNSLFKEKSVYFRNALVRSNYFNNELGVKEDKNYLVKFYENLLLGKNNNLHSEDLIVKELAKK